MTAYIFRKMRLSVGKWFHADELEIEEDDVSLTREMICKFVNEHKTK